MKNNIWQLIEEEVRNSPTDMAGSVETKDIIKAENTLMVKFSDSYIKFLKKYGGMIMPGHFIYGLKKQRSMGDTLWSVIDNTKFYKDQQGWIGIEDWYVISDDGSGNPIGIDPSGKVWLSDHDSGFEKILLADSFEEFLYKLHTETLYDQPVIT